MKINDEDMINIIGGAITLNNTFLNSLARIITVFLDIGRIIGSSINRHKNKNYCT